MAKLPKLIKALLDFSRTLPEQLLAQGYAIVKAMTGNTNFTNLPVDLGLLKTALDIYAGLIAEARDGSKRAIAARNSQGQEVIWMLRALATCVELNAKDDMNKFLSSGFQPRATTRTPAQPLAPAQTIASLDQGISGQLLAWINAVRKAKHYELRAGAAGAGGATPTSWQSVTVPNAKTAAPINGLLPGTTYAVQIRAYGQLGYTEWSDSVSRMVI